jgi:hypothetical protein
MAVKAEVQISLESLSAVTHLRSTDHGSYLADVPRRRESREHAVLEYHIVDKGRIS